MIRISAAGHMNTTASEDVLNIVISVIIAKEEIRQPSLQDRCLFCTERCL